MRGQENEKTKRQDKRD
jgi:hypothetical protein